ncbi:MAG: serine/threonine-protein kinase [Gemmatimonadetes bacterium]|nr:serine/threonine-protein kinase [Gemmatimonadota bacterium]
MSLDPQELVGQTLGNCVVDRLIGTGGLTWIYQGHLNTEGTQVAIKVLRPRYAGDPQFESRFRNEFQIASEFVHPNIVQILEVGRDRGITYFAMDYHPESLADRLEAGGPMGEDEVIDLAACVARALDFAHSAGFIHRDIKVENILLAADGRPVVADFGIARAISGYVSATGQNMTIGTPHYISPEQAQGRKLDGRSDLYALGVTLYKAVTGTVPFSSTDWFELARMHVEEPPEAPRVKRPDISMRLERIVLRLLAKQPDDRYPSAAALLAELEDIRDPERRTSTFGADGLAALSPARRLPKWVWPAAAVTLVVAVAILFVLLVQRG